MSDGEEESNREEYSNSSDSDELFEDYPDDIPSEEEHDVTPVDSDGEEGLGGETTFKIIEDKKIIEMLKSETVLQPVPKDER
jgi:hypothetical protein